MKKNKRKFKKSSFGFVDMLLTKRLIEQRPLQVESTPLQPIKKEFHVNNVANKLHPKYQLLKVTKIENLTSDVKTIYLSGDKENKISPFRPGQYINLCFDINNKIISRPYSICSSLRDAIKNNYYRLAVKCVLKGVASNYIHNNLKIGTFIKCTGPDGDFYHTSLRDKKHLICIAGGIGITPFLSIAKTIYENNLDLTIDIYYSNRKFSNIIFFEELNNLSKISLKIKVHYYLTQEENININAKHQRIDIKELKNNSFFNEASFFICGPKNLCKDIENQLLNENIPRKLIRIESSNQYSKPTSYLEYKNIGNQVKYKIKIKTRDGFVTIDAHYTDTILVSLQKGNIAIKSNCLSGKCSWCRVRLVKGQVFEPKGVNQYRKADDINKIIYTCTTFPITDLELDIL